MLAIAQHLRGHGNLVRVVLDGRNRNACRDGPMTGTETLASSLAAATGAFGGSGTFPRLPSMTLGEKPRCGFRLGV